jgi:membrane-bound ClpP family serine protease
MTLTAILIILFLAILLMIAEVLVVPGVGFVGIFGFLLLLFSVYLAYERSMNTGHLVLAVGAFSSVGILILSLRAKTWERVSLKTTLAGRSNSDNYEELFQVGEIGKTTSRLNPVGNARIKNKLVEVTSFSEFVDQNVEIEIVQIEANKIIVKLKQ